MNTNDPNNPNLIKNTILKPFYNDKVINLVRGNLANLELVAGVNSIYTAPTNVTFVNATINLVNDSSVDISIKIYISKFTTPTRADLIESSNFIIAANETYIRDNMKLSPGETIFIDTQSLNVIVRIDGAENIII